ncbi:hypothetical protein [Limoniibacter endophyticus]|uniref:Uncharacterized protein n=1 Tax=Limoniibacter endophyticus TaxID=1565040 RepID=A0A8J3GHK4_9HYPH|nr:hypothetical protein [Limoniibacter endophyticus]GHC75427.1 hypothetical protein GCM10010136_25320 [Limoniibacter endophyticus]
MNMTNAIQSSVAVTIIAAVSLFAAISSAASQDGEMLDVYGPIYKEAALLEAQASICGTNIEASDVAFKKLMREENLPEDIAVEIVSDMATVIIDESAATKDSAARFCSEVPSMVAKL